MARNFTSIQGQFTCPKTMCHSHDAINAHRGWLAGPAREQNDLDQSETGALVWIGTILRCLDLNNTYRFDGGRIETLMRSVILSYRANKPDQNSGNDD
jgi:hypothetical protein